MTPSSSVARPQSQSLEASDPGPSVFASIRTKSGSSGDTVVGQMNMSNVTALVKERWKKRKWKIKQKASLEPNWQGHLKNK